MFFILSKTITYLALPLPLLTICLLVYIFVRKQKIRRIAGILFVALFFLFSNPFLINQLMQWWEAPATPIQALDSSYDAAIILGGITASDQKPLDRIHLHKGADRIMHVVQLYKLGRVKKIIVTGGSGLLLEEPGSRSEASQIRQVLLISGVFPADIILEEKSRNTRENALYTARLLEEKSLNKDRLLLVTSAFHMRRAMGCFNQLALFPQSYSTDFYANEQEYDPVSLLIPTDDAFPTWTRLIKEWIGYLAYSTMGYI
jgi:uncharacterized SAM-binding protein YcdF (DUF218 family)